jgi:lipopolysaccharide exporter
MTGLRRSILYSFAESYGSMLLSLLSFMLLARLLTPPEVGVFSVAMALLSITQVVRDFGIVSYLISKAELTDSHIGSAWALAMLMGIGLFSLVQLGAPLLAQFYAHAGLGTVARVIACNFLILPFNSVCLALLRREMQFDQVMRVNLSGSAVATTTTVLLAWQGWGALALALGAVLNNLTVMLGLLACGAAQRLRRPTLARWRDVLSFGWPVTLANICSSVAMDINDLVVGKFMGFRDVAIVSRAQGLMNLFHRDFMAAVRNVAYPALARAARSGQALEQHYLRYVGNVTAVAWPFYGFVALFPLEVLRLMFGPQWDASAPLVPLFCAAGAVSGLNSLVAAVMLADGHARLYSRAEMLFQPARAACMCLVVYVWRDVQVFAWAFFGVACASVPWYYAFKQRCQPTDFRALARTVAPNLALTAAALAPAMLAVAGWRQPGQPLPLPVFLGCAALAAAAWLAALRLLRQPLYPELAATLARRRKPAA